MTLNAEALKAWLLFSFSLGCWTLLTLLLSRRGERRNRLTMALFVGLLLLPPLQAYLELALGGTALPWLDLLRYRLTWAYGPLLWLCLHQALLLPALPGRQLLLHALPMLSVCALGLAQAEWLGSPLLVAALLLQVLIYAASGVRLLMRHRARLAQLTQGHRNSSYYWLLYLAGGLLVATCFDLVVHAMAWQGQLPPRALLLGAALLLALYVDLMALFAIYQPEVFVAESGGTEEAAPPAPLPGVQLAASPAEPPKGAPLRVVELSPELARELAQRLQALAQQHKPHLDEHMSLGKLAALLDLTSHQLSELLNLHMGSSFYDYLNELRYQEALQLLEQPEGLQALTVADIAYRAGFNNRNSFYKVFKDKTGLTPAEYRKRWAKQA
ncbi:helix-turn-helix domain-containing protein [Paucibacter sp. DJ2R-2]|uniref:helix-turn-helix domain-containing protein n=1 Tax=Paucibacter sp. DJ2R-2 TaxID=2893558 RepID=UPI0021E50C51|nr:AraC family transcriptional regulator [Paucibacter sp. DJ2R-2]MCV2422860.1 AraC family transcriptional regulator [Paucibacter sp. DJ4R-1]MCV2440756.1 AraC family transcriptional regulator [Paucibacter sp. DJ2R-2]